MMQHHVFSQDGYDICQTACPVEPFFGNQMRVASPKEEDPLVFPGGFSHLSGNLQQRGLLCVDNACLKFTHRLKVLLKSIYTGCHMFTVAIKIF